MLGILLLHLTWLTTSVGKTMDPRCFDNCKCCKHETCSPRWTFPNVCDLGCIDGHRGGRCYELCEYENCKSCVDAVTECDTCYDSYYPGPNKDCTSQCPQNCSSCTSRTFCTKCKDGFYNENGTTTCEYFQCPLNCECTHSGTDCDSCRAGYYNTTSLCKSTCPANCKTCLSKELCSDCKPGFYNGYKYNNVASIPLKNCTFECSESCISCHAYDNCSRCVSGKYGLTCQEDCSVGCVGRTCLIESGICNCAANFTGEKCMECVDGFYGTFCNKTCSEHCKGHVCDKMSGDCTEGCVSNTVVGKKCNTCMSDMYGELCDKVCPVNCKNMICERVNGTCFKGCNTNFNGPYCDSCFPGKYGHSCDLSCPDNCADGVCKRNSGNCFTCTGNYNGLKCNVCKPGYFGSSCKDLCSLRCSENICDKNTGRCLFGCTKGYSGDNCCVKSENCMNCSSNNECRVCKPGYYQQRCRDECQGGCMDTCEFSTGVCNRCKENLYGAFCTFICSENCNFTSGVYTGQCKQSDGACINGCNVGYHGATCDKKCSNKCIGNVCRQDTGICINGCVGEHDDPECFLSSETCENNKINSVTAAVFGTLFALASIIIILQSLIIVRQRRRIRVGKTKSCNVTYENKLAVIELQTPYDRLNDYVNDCSETTYVNKQT